MRYFLALLLASISSVAAETTIPLGQIYGHRMPGTIKLSDAVTPGRVPPEKEWVSSIRLMLARPKSGKDDPGFAVRAVGPLALEEFHAKLAGLSGDPQPLTTSDRVSIGFHSRELARYVHLTSVSRNGDTFTLRYRFVLHESQETTTHFALVPVGKLDAGRYEVRVVLSEEASTEEKELAERFVCESYQFDVHEVAAPTSQTE